MMRKSRKEMKSRNKITRRKKNNKKITRRKHKHKRTKTRKSRKMKGKGPMFSRTIPIHNDIGPPTANIELSPHWVKKSDVKDDICALCLEPLHNVGRKHVVYELPCGHQFHAYCLHELCDNIEQIGVNVNGHVRIPCPICRELFDPDKHCYDVLGFTKRDTTFVSQDHMNVLESRDYSGEN